jgi:hypothetical protein
MNILVSFVITGGVTFYGGPPFEDQALYCGGTYNEGNVPWAALPVEWYQTGRARCGDWILVEYGDGGQHLAQARDAGLLSHYTVWDTGLPFVADLPFYWRDGHRTMTGRVTNLSARERAWRERRAWSGLPSPSTY